jgi:hypothetical protein
MFWELGSGGSADTGFATIIMVESNSRVIKIVPVKILGVLSLFIPIFLHTIYLMRNNVYMCFLYFKQKFFVFIHKPLLCWYVFYCEKFSYINR